MYDIVLIDMDDTIIDFEKNEKGALQQAMDLNQIEFTSELYEIYKLINHELWNSFEKGIYNKNEILTLRFDLLFAQTGIYGDAAQVNHDYLVSMGNHIVFEPGAIELLEALHGKTKLIIVTNGAQLAQDIKLENAGIKKYFDEIFISDAVGYHKPDPNFFKAVEKKVGIFDKNRTLILGDGLTSDMLGGATYGIHTCWYNKKGLDLPKEFTPTYVVQQLDEVKRIVLGN
jgi:2-haloacid dehalogenase